MSLIYSFLFSLHGRNLCHQAVVLTFSTAAVQVFFAVGRFPLDFDSVAWGLHGVNFFDSVSLERSLRTLGKLLFRYLACQPNLKFAGIRVRSASVGVTFLSWGNVALLVFPC